MVKGAENPTAGLGCSDATILEMEKQRPEQLPTCFLRTSPLVSGHGLGAGVMAVDEMYALPWSTSGGGRLAKSYFPPYIGPACCYKSEIRISNLSQGFFFLIYKLL